MLDTLIAVRFDRRMGSGKTCPCLLSGLRADGEEVEVVAKFSAGCERGVGGLVAEAIAALLAADLDLPIPEPFLVKFDPSFADLITDAKIAELVRKSSDARAAFGSSKLPPGYALQPKDKWVTTIMRPQAAEIFAFDALIQNPDRRPENPNCLFNGRDFAIFDHELAFITTVLFGWKPPWQTDGLSNMKNRHLFYRELQDKEHDFSRLSGAWQAISDARLNQYLQALTPAWVTGNNVAQEALTYIAQVRDNIEPALAEVKRVLS